MAGLYRKEPLGEGQPNPWPGKFEIEGGVCQSYPVTDRNLGMLGESGSQVCFNVLNSHFRHLSQN